MAEPVDEQQTMEAFVKVFEEIPGVKDILSDQLVNKKFCALNKMNKLEEAVKNIMVDLEQRVNSVIKE